MIKEKKIHHQLFMIETEFAEALRQLYDRRVFHIAEIDKARLLKLRVWSERYAVPISYILEKVLPLLWQRMPKHVQARSQKSRTLGVSIAQLTSPTTEQILLNCTLADFPEGENFESRREARIDDCIELIDIDNDTLPSKPKSVLSYKALTSFVDAYAKKIERKRTTLSRIAVKRRKMHYRGNPWL
jgi:hypothetical protein